MGGPQFQGDGDEAGAQRDGEASEAATAGAEGTAAGPSGKNREADAADLSQDVLCDVRSSLGPFKHSFCIHPSSHPSFIHLTE